jgi:hypothetical protein
MDALDQILDLKKKLRKARHKNKQLVYDLSRIEYILAECIELLNKVGKRANQNKDSFTHLWCENMLIDIGKILDLPRFGVDTIDNNETKR